MRDTKDDNCERMSTSKPFFTESIFQIQKKRIAEIKLKNSMDSNLTIQNPNILQKAKQMILFNDLAIEENSNWEYSTFDSELYYNEETPIIKNPEWSQSNVQSAQKGIEIRGLIFRSKQLIQHEYVNLEISSAFSLKGESSFWIITRSKDNFDEKSAVIRVSKEDKCQKLFLSLGTFVKDTHKNLIFKVFSRQQLIERSVVKSNAYIENDICDVKAYVLDAGDENIIVRIHVNVGKHENKVCTEFFLPNNGISRLMLAGSGQHCCIKSMICNCLLKPKLEMMDNHTDTDPNNMLTTEKRNCDCCLIF